MKITIDTDKQSIIDEENGYIVATDGSMRILHGVPCGEKEWLTDNPANAAENFAKTHPEFVIEQPAGISMRARFSKI